MSLDVTLTINKPTEVFSRNITHNLTEMAHAAGIYEALWHPEDKGYTKAYEIIHMLEIGLDRLKNRPEYYKQLNPDSNWGNYEGLVSFVEGYLNACLENPDADIGVSR